MPCPGASRIRRRPCGLVQPRTGRGRVQIGRETGASIKVDLRAASPDHLDAGKHLRRNFGSKRPRALLRGDGSGGAIRVTTLHSSSVPNELDMSVKSFPISPAWMPHHEPVVLDLDRRDRGLVRRPSTTNPSSKKASRCAGVRCRAARATAAHASHDKARRIVRCAQSGAAQALPMSFGGPRPQYEYAVLVGAFARRPVTAARCTKLRATLAIKQSRRCIEQHGRQQSSAACSHVLQRIIADEDDACAAPAADPATTLHKRPAATQPTRRRRRSRRRPTPARVAATHRPAATPTQHRHHHQNQYAAAAREYDARSPRKLVKTLYSSPPSNEHYQRTTRSRSRRRSGGVAKPMQNASRCSSRKAC